nr:ERF family protein [Acidobacteriota bacterium]
MSAQIYELIPKVMAEVGAIEKARRNEQQKYFFRGIDDVLAAFQPVLAKHRVFYVPEVLDKDVTERETKNGTTLIYTTLA